MLVLIPLVRFIHTLKCLILWVLKLGSLWWKQKFKDKIFHPVPLQYLWGGISLPQLPLTSKAYKFQSLLTSLRMTKEITEGEYNTEITLKNTKTWTLFLLLSLVASHSLTFSLLSPSCFLLSCRSLLAAFELFACLSLDLVEFLLSSPLSWLDLAFFRFRGGTRYI